MAVPLSQRGVPATGIELSRPMIDQLRTKADEATIPVVGRRRHGDRHSRGEIHARLPRPQHDRQLPNSGGQVECFRNAARHLIPGGRFAAELWVPELRKLPPGQQALVFHCEPGYIGVDTYDVLRQHVVSHHFTFDDGRQAWISRCPSRYIWSAELDLMAQLAGFMLETRHAD